MSDIMKLVGTLTELFLAAAVFNYVIKAVNKKYRKQIMASKYKDLFNLLMKLTIKNHRLFGFGALLLGTAHGLYELNATGFVLGNGYIMAGVLTLASMALLTVLGVFGFAVKKSKRGVWFYAHRFIAAFAIMALGLHLVL